MTPPLEYALANAALAVPLAVLAAAGSLTRRPAVVHALWLLVLLLLFAPPLWRVPLPARPADGDPSAASSRPTEPFAATEDDTRPRLAADDGVARPQFWTDFDSSSRPSKTPGVPPDNAATVGDFALPWQTVVTAVWLGGTVGYLGLAVARGAAFGRLLQH